MNDLTGMFDQGTELDARLEQAGYILKQAADEEGVDLAEYSNEDVSEMLANIMDNDGAGAGEGGGDEYEGKTAADITVADVSLELNKRAAAEGFDLSQLDAGTYEELFDKVASEMTDPYYHEEQQKWAAHAENMDQLGRIAAQGFVDEINKIAADEDDDDDDDEDKKIKKASYLLKQAIYEKVRTPGVRESLRGAATAAGRKIKGGVNRAFERVGNKAIDTAAGEKGMHQVSSVARRQQLGRRVTGAAAGGTAGVGAAAYGGKRLMDKGEGKGRKKKASLEEVAYAVDILRASGYDL